MANEHLDLTPTKEFQTKKRQRGGAHYKKVHGDLNAFAQAQTSKLDEIVRQYKRDRELLSGYSQGLVFKLQTSQKVSDEQFRKSLMAADIRTLISRPGEQANWVISAEDLKFSKLKSKIHDRLKIDNENPDKEKTTFIDGINMFDKITIKDKLGVRLNENPMGKFETAKINVSLITGENKNDKSKLSSATDYVVKLVNKNGYQLHSKIMTENLCVLSIDCDINLLNTIAKIDIVDHIDRIPDFTLEKTLGNDKSAKTPLDPPPDDAPGILIVDTGVNNHPMLDLAIPPDGRVGLPDRDFDDVKKHGTMVAGNALYGNLEPLIKEDAFVAKFRIYSAKILYQNNDGTVNQQEDIFKVLIDSLMEIKNRHKNCKIVNLSINDTTRTHAPINEQLKFASLIDDLSVQYSDTVFVVSMGNHKNAVSEYPANLLTGDADFLLRDPASSVHALSVGSLQVAQQNVLVPSEFTRVGPGLNDMIKPELVEIGGGSYKRSTVLNPDYPQEQFTKAAGTSFSAPIVANYLAELIKKFPDRSRNSHIALLLASCEYSNITSHPFSGSFSNINTQNFLKKCYTYGYGKPNLDYALASDTNRVALQYEGKISAGHVRYFEIKIPDEFSTEKGRRSITVSLVFDPPVVRTRANYFGIKMDFYMYRNKTMVEVQRQHSDIDFEDNADDTQEVDNNLSAGDKIRFVPGPRVRSNTPHQKGTYIMDRAHINPSKPLILVVVCRKRWNVTKPQNFAVVVTLEHSVEIDLYNKVRDLNTVAPSVQLKVSQR